MHYDTIVYGATFYGCGLAASLPGRTLIVEPLPLVGSDFALTFNGGCHWEAEPESAAAREYLAELREHGALTADGRAAIPAFSTLLAKWCLARKLEIQLSCQVVDFKDGVAEAVGVGGPCRYETGAFIDARPRCGAAGAWLTALVAVPPGTSAGTAGPFVLRPSFAPGEMLLAYRLTADMDWAAARAAFHRAWETRPEGLRQAVLLLIGTALDYRQFDNPVLALDAGCCGRRAE